MKQYLINNKLYNCELLTENMESGKEFYFLRGIDDTADVICVAVDQMPEEYVPNLYTLSKGQVYSHVDYYYIAEGGEEIDLNRQHKLVFDSNGEPVVEGGFYRTEKGEIILVAKNYRKSHVTNKYASYGNLEGVLEGAEKVNADEYSFFTGNKIETPVEVEYSGHSVYADTSEMIQSSLSDEQVHYSQHSDYYENEDGEYILREDIYNDLTGEYFICEHCDTIHPIEEENEARDGYVCDDCIEDYYIYSDAMDTYINREEAVKVCGEYVTEDYRDRNATQCDNCGAYEWNEDVVETEDGYNLCDMCCNDFECNGEYWFKDDDFINNYHDNPTYKFYGTGSKYLGCEWEIQGGGENGRVARAIFGDVDEMWCCHDGSLNDGFEVITHPCTPNYLLKNIDWEHLTERVDDFGYYDVDGAGFHIHISKDHFESRSHIGKLVRFFAEHYCGLVKFGCRSDEDAYHWAKPTDVEDLDTFKSCYEVAYSERYSAVNVRPDETVEIRLFNTSYNPRVIRSYIQFADVISDLANGKYADMTFENMKHIALEREYTELVERLERHNLV